MTVLDDLDAVTEAIQQGLSGFGTPTPAGRHADLGETAAMLAIRPELVRRELAARGFQGEIGLGELPSGGVRTLSPTGAFGDRTGATADMGAAVLAAWTECLIESLRAAGPPAPVRQARPMPRGIRMSAPGSERCSLSSNSGRGPASCQRASASAARRSTDAARRSGVVARALGRRFESVSRDQS